MWFQLTCANTGNYFNAIPPPPPHTIKTICYSCKSNKKRDQVIADNPVKLLWCHQHLHWQFEITLFIKYNCMVLTKYRISKKTKTKQTCNKKSLPILFTNLHAALFLLQLSLWKTNNSFLVISTSSLFSQSGLPKFLVFTLFLNMPITSSSLHMYILREVRTFWTFLECSLTKS